MLSLSSEMFCCLSCTSRAGQCRCSPWTFQDPSGLSCTGSHTASMGLSWAPAPEHPMSRGFSNRWSMEWQSMNKMFLNRLKMFSDVMHALVFHMALLGFSESLLFLFSAAPLFVEELIDQAAAVGQCVTLSCRTAAHSSLHINWFRGDVGIPVQSP